MKENNNAGTNELSGRTIPQPMVATEIVAPVGSVRTANGSGVLGSVRLSGGQENYLLEAGQDKHLTEKNRRR